MTLIKLSWIMISKIKLYNRFYQFFLKLIIEVKQLKEENRHIKR